MRSLVVPTNDREVRALLRSLGEPITLFGEREVRELLSSTGCNPLRMHKAECKLVLPMHMATGY